MMQYLRYVCSFLVVAATGCASRDEPPPSIPLEDRLQPNRSQSLQSRWR